MSLSNNFPALRPSLLLDFAGSETIDPRITFARASTARFYDQNTVAKAEENLLLNSGTLSGTGWTASEMTLTLAAGTAPDGTATATKAIPSTNNIAHSIFQSATVAGSNVQSCFVKADGYTKVALRESQTGAYYASFELSGAGTVLDQSSATGAITSVGNGWYRISMVGTITGTTRWSVYVLAAGYTTGAPGAFAGDGTSGVLVWGAQFEQRSAVTAYTATTTAPITRYQPQLMTAAANVARLDHDPITREARGLLIEESRSNLVTFTEAFDNAAWTKGQSSISANAAIAPDGSLTADRLVEDTASAQHEARQSFTFTGSTAYTLSVYAKTSGRNLLVYLDGYGGGANFDLAAGTVASTVGVAPSSSSITSVGNGWYRCSISVVWGAGSTNNVRFLTLSGTTSSYTGDGYSGIFVWGAQLEAGAFATSYIARLDATAASRAADAASMTGTSFTSWHRADEGTLYAEAVAPNPNNFPAVACLARADNSYNSINILYNTAGAAGGIFEVGVNGVQQVASVVVTAPRTSYSKFAGAYALNDFAISCNGGAAATDTSGLLPVVDQLRLGLLYNGATILNGHLKKVAFYARRLTNAQLQALTR